MWKLVHIFISQPSVSPHVVWICKQLEVCEISSTSDSAEKLKSNCYHCQHTQTTYSELLTLAQYAANEAACFIEYLSFCRLFSLTVSNKCNSIGTAVGIRVLLSDSVALILFHINQFSMNHKLIDKPCQRLEMYLINNRGINSYSPVTVMHNIEELWPLRSVV